jgi:hypothetical protein
VATLLGGRAVAGTAASSSTPSEWDDAKRASRRDGKCGVSGGCDILRLGLKVSYETETAGLGSSLGAGDGRTAEELKSLRASCGQPRFQSKTIASRKTVGTRSNNGAYVTCGVGWA